MKLKNTTKNKTAKQATRPIGRNFKMCVSSHSGAIFLRMIWRRFWCEICEYMRVEAGGPARCVRPVEGFGFGKNLARMMHLI